MPRQRAINPEFWVDDKLAEVSPLARLFFIGMWNYADDYGVIEYSLPKLKVQIFPYDTIEIQLLIDELIKTRRVLAFESEGKKWLYIRKFLKWQKVDKPSQKRNPVPPENIDEYENTRRGVGEESESPRSEVKRSKVKRSKPLAAKAAEEDTPWDFPSYLAGMKKSPNKLVKIVAAYWVVKEFAFETKAAAEANLKRDLKAAKDLEGYPGTKIMDTMKYLNEKADFKWTLETVFKYINEIK